jgi:hypothetical protein
VICCDTCPYSPTCEEEIVLLRPIGLGDEEEWGEEE